MTIYPYQISEVVDVKRGDANRVVTGSIWLNDAPLNISGSTVIFVMYNPESGSATRSSGSVTTATSGSVAYTLTAAQLAVAGTRLCEWEITTGSMVVTNPTYQYMLLKIREDLR